ncbi:MAG: hypothetical protein WBO57_09190, partial [Gammaproteobacteria bacterium]
MTMTANYPMHKKQPGMLFMLLLWLWVCPHVSAAQTAAPSSATPEQQASATTAPVAMEIASVIRGHNRNWAEVSITVRPVEPSVDAVTITGHGPDGMVIQPSSHTVNIQRGVTETAKFRIYNPQGEWTDLGPLSFAASEKSGDGTYVANITVTWPQGFDSGNIFHRPHWLWLAIVGAVAWFLLLSRQARTSIRNSWQQPGSPRFLLDLFTLLVVEIFIISKLNPEYLLTQTTTTGG